MVGLLSGLSADALRVGAFVAAAAPRSQPSVLILFAVLFAIFYFVLFAPTRKRQKQHEALLAELKKGDEVVTSGGIYGSVAAVEDKIVHLRIADQVKIKIDKSSVAGLVKSATAE